MQELRIWKPLLTKDAQKYISGFEILSQLALLIMASERFSWKHMQISIPTSSDNTSAESSINRQLSAKEPSATFLQLISQWALHRNIALSVTQMISAETSCTSGKHTLVSGLPWRRSFLLDVWRNSFRLAITQLWKKVFCACMSAAVFRDAFASLVFSGF